MKRLTADEIRGVWAGSVMTWDEKLRYDERAYARSVEQILKHNPAGVYTSGSTGEFYAIDEDEFKAMVDIQAQLCGDVDTPLQIGCCSDATHKTLRLFEYAASKPAVGAAQIALPYWMQMNDREILQFFADLYHACPDLPIVHYNIPRSKRFLHADDYLKILEVCPSLVGVKYTFAGSHFGELQNDIRQTPMLSYFVAENFLATAMQMGARGTYSSLVGMNPSYLLSYYRLADEEQWDEAMKIQARLADFFRQLNGLIRELKEGDADPVVDKAMAVASGFLQAHQRCRKPYLGWSDQSIAILRRFIEEVCPELAYHAQPVC